MSERGARRGVGAPFYAPPRRKTSAEIISEARAAINGEMCSASNGAGMTGGACGGGGALRPLRTRRPFTPREPQRTLFTERSQKKDTRPPSAFDLKSLSLSENNEDPMLVSMGARIASLDEDSLNEILTDTQNTRKKPAAVRNQYRSVQERSSDGWAGFPRLPHLSGRSKPLHRRSGQATSDEAKTEWDLSQAISIIRPLGNSDTNVSNDNTSKSLSPDSNTKRKQFAGSKSVSHDAGSGNCNKALGDIAVKHLDVQMPNTSTDHYESMSILELSEALSQRNRDVNRTIMLMEVLLKTLEKTSPPHSLRDLVLRSLYTHIDNEDERVLVAIARAMLTMRVTGKHLAAACKLVFKIARNDKNDHFFRDSNLLELLVEGCGLAEPVSEGECCVYGAGALRFLALEPALRARAHAAGALHLAALHLKILNNAKAENPRGVSEQSTHALYQLTGALRNLAGSGERDARQFVSSGALAELLAALLHHTDRDVLTNVARCLSVLSAEWSCCAWLCASSASAGALVRALAACAPRPALAVRLAYTLGNMAARDDQARINIYNEEGSVDVLLTILESYTNRSDHEPRDPDPDPDVHLIGTDLGGSDGSNEDVLIKTVRVVANLCLAERAGRGLAAIYAERCIKALLACLDLAEKSGGSMDLPEEERASIIERREELATAALATLNNITFYREPPEPPDPLDEPLDKLCKTICRWLRLMDKGAGIGSAGCEAVRALGNVSRSPRAAQLLVLEGALDNLLPYLQHGEASVRCAAAGVLVNVCGAGVETRRAACIASRALYEAARRLRRGAVVGEGQGEVEGEGPCGALLARALWNAHAHAHAPLDAEHAHHAATALAIFIDDETVFAACEASRTGDRRASDPALLKNHVKFNLDNNNYPDELDYNLKSKAFVRALSVDRVVESSDDDADRTACSGEDLGFEEGDITGEDDCECGPCVRLAAWEELVGVAIPLLEKLKPSRADASVGTD